MLLSPSLKSYLVFLLGLCSELFILQLTSAKIVQTLVAKWYFHHFVSTFLCILPPISHFLDKYLGNSQSPHPDVY